MNNSIVKSNVKVRAWEEADAESLARQANNMKIWNNVRDYFPQPYTLQDASDFIKLTLNRPVAQDFAVSVDGKIAGGIGLVPQSDVERFSAEIGYWLGVDYWNQGYMTEALKIVIDYLFENTNIVRLFAPVFEFNRPSARVLEKLGFRFVGIFNKAAFKNNAFVNILYYELVR